MLVDPISAKNLGDTAQITTNKTEVDFKFISKIDLSNENELTKGEESFPGEKKFIQMIEKSNKELKNEDISLKFAIHEKTKAITIKVIKTAVDGKKEILKEFPPEKILDMVASMMERAGLFVDKRG